MMELMNLKEWHKNRRRTSRVFVVECLVLGMEYSLTFPTLWLYLNTLVNTSHKETYYSLISSSFLVSGVFFTIFIGCSISKSQNIRIMFFIGNMVAVIGNLMYVLHFSPCCIVLGRFLGGAGSSLRAVISFEISKTYSDKEVSSKLSLMGMAFSFGFIIGPAVNLLFESVEFHIGPLHITYANLPGLYMAGLFLITQIYCFVSLHNISQEYNLIVREEYNALMKTSFKEKELAHVTESYFVGNDSIHSSLYGANDVSSTLPRKKRTELIEDSLPNQSLPENRQMLQHQSNGRRQKNHQEYTRNANNLSPTDSYNLGEKVPLLAGNEVKRQTTVGGIRQKSNNELIISLLTFFKWFWMVSFVLWLPLTLLDVLEKGIAGVNGIAFGVSCILTIVLFVFSFTAFSTETIRISPFFLITLAFFELVFAVLKIHSVNFQVNITLRVFWIILFATVIALLIIEVSASSRIRTLNKKNMRLVFAKFGILTALMLAAFLLKWLEYVCFTFMVFSLLTFIILALRKTSVI